MNLNRRKSELTTNFSIRVKKRGQHDNTHDNIVDESINEIIPYKLVTLKVLLSIILYIMSGGILYLLARLIPKLYLFLNCSMCNFAEADMFVVVDFYNNYNVVHAYYENFYRRNPLLNYIFSFKTKNKSIKASMEDSAYVGEDYLSSKEETLVLYYRHNKYIFNDKKKEFEPVKMDFTVFANSEIHLLFSSGLSRVLDFNYLLNKFGKNVIVLEERSFFRIALSQLIHPFYIYQIFSIVIWCMGEYYSLCIILIISAFIMIFMNSLQNFKNINKISNFAISGNAKIYRKFTDENSEFDLSHKIEMLNNRIQYIVPGDLIELQNSQIIPCDCILLDGICTVNESDLTGESSLVMKCSLPCDDQKFDYIVNSKSILYSGTQIEKCESILKDGKIKAVVINTGFNTHRGDMIQNILFQKPSNFSFTNDIVTFISIMAIIYGIAAYCYYNFSLGDDGKMLDPNIVVNMIDLLTIVIPPTLPICYTFNTYYYHYLLNKQSIYCISDLRMNAAGRVNIVVIDKTGTLTEEGLDLYGYQTTKTKSNESNPVVNEKASLEEIKDPHDFNKIFEEDEKDQEENIEQDKKNNTIPIFLMNGKYNYNKNYKIKFDEIESSAKIYINLHQEFWKKYSNDRMFDIFLKETEKKFNKNEDYDKLKTNQKKVSPNVENRDSISSKDNNQISVAPKRKSRFSRLFYNMVRRTSITAMENKFDDSYLTDPRLNVIYFVECLATCHSIYKLNGNHFGNNIDRKIFDNLGWILVRTDEVDLIRRKNSGNKNTINAESIKYQMIPNKAFKVNEETYFKSISTISPESELKNFKLTILKRFEFSSKFQSMSVIVHNFFDDTFRFFIKGSPERIIYMCKPETIPLNFNEKLIEHTQNGLRVLACATKLLPKLNPSIYENENERSKFENELAFLGLIVFKNKLKKDTKQVIFKLRKSQCKLVIATGDNPFTTISVAKESEFIDKDTKMFLIDHDEDKLKFSFLFKKESIETKKSSNKNVQIINNSDVLSKGKLNQSKEINEIFIDKTDRKLINEKEKQEILPKITLKNLENNLDATNLSNFFNLWDMYNSTNGKNNSIICISGRAFTNILFIYKNLKDRIYSRKSKINMIDENKHFTEMKKLLNIIESNGKIFFRMTPSDKVELVSFFKENKSNIVAMCGDGANDCGALLTADVGISIKHKEGSNVTSHFYSNSGSVESLDIIIKNGRACFENTKIIYEYMIIYAVIQLVTYLILTKKNDDFTKSQYLGIDFFIVFVKSFLISKTASNVKIMKDKPNLTILNIKFILSLLGQLVIQVGTIIIFFEVSLNPTDTKFNLITGQIKTKAIAGDNLTSLNSFLYVLTCFQYSWVILVLNFTAVHKKSIFTNKPYTIYMISIMFILIGLISVNYFDGFGLTFNVSKLVLYIFYIIV